MDGYTPADVNLLKQDAQGSNFGNQLSEEAGQALTSSEMITSNPKNKAFINPLAAKRAADEAFQAGDLNLAYSRFNDAVKAADLMAHNPKAAEYFAKEIEKADKKVQKKPNSKTARDWDQDLHDLARSPFLIREDLDLKNLGLAYSVAMKTGDKTPVEAVYRQLAQDLMNDPMGWSDARLWNSLNSVRASFGRPAMTPDQFYQIEFGPQQQQGQDVPQQQPGQVVQQQQGQDVPQQQPGQVVQQQQRQDVPQQQRQDVAQQQRQDATQQQGDSPAITAGQKLVTNDKVMPLLMQAIQTEKQQGPQAAIPMLKQAVELSGPATIPAIQQRIKDGMQELKQILPANTKLSNEEQSFLMGAVMSRALMPVNCRMELALALNNTKDFAGAQALLNDLQKGYPAADKSPMFKLIMDKAKAGQPVSEDDIQKAMQASEAQIAQQAQQTAAGQDGKQTTSRKTEQQAGNNTAGKTDAAQTSGKGSAKTDAAQTSGNSSDAQQTAAAQQSAAVQKPQERVVSKSDKLEDHLKNAVAWTQQDGKLSKESTQEFTNAIALAKKATEPAEQKVNELQKTVESKQTDLFNQQGKLAILQAQLKQQQGAQDKVVDDQTKVKKEVDGENLLQKGADLWTHAITFGHGKTEKEEKIAADDTQKQSIQKNIDDIQKKIDDQQKLVKTQTDAVADAKKQLDSANVDLNKVNKPLSEALSYYGSALQKSTDKDERAAGLAVIAHAGSINSDIAASDRFKQIMSQVPLSPLGAEQLAEKVSKEQGYDKAKFYYQKAIDAAGPADKASLEKLAQKVGEIAGKGIDPVTGQKATDAGTLTQDVLKAVRMPVDIRMAAAVAQSKDDPAGALKALEDLKKQNPDAEKMASFSLAYDRFKAGKSVTQDELDQAGIKDLMAKAAASAVDKATAGGKTDAPVNRENFLVDLGGFALSSSLGWSTFKAMGGDKAAQTLSKAAIERIVGTGAQAAKTPGALESIKALAGEAANLAKGGSGAVEAAKTVKSVADAGKLAEIAKDVKIAADLAKVGTVGGEVIAATGGAAAAGTEVAAGAGVAGEIIAGLTAVEATAGTVAVGSTAASAAVVDAPITVPVALTAAGVALLAGGAAWAVSALSKSAVNNVTNTGEKDISKTALYDGLNWMPIGGLKYGKGFAEGLAKEAIAKDMLKAGSSSTQVRLELAKLAGRKGVESVALDLPKSVKGVLGWETAYKLAPFTGAGLGMLPYNAANGVLDVATQKTNTATGKAYTWDEAVVGQSALTASEALGFGLFDKMHLSAKFKADKAADVIAKQAKAAEFLKANGEHDLAEALVQNPTAKAKAGQVIADKASGIAKATQDQADKLVSRIPEELRTKAAEHKTVKGIAQLGKSTGEFLGDVKEGMRTLIVPIGTVMPLAKQFGFDGATRVYDAQTGRAIKVAPEAAQQAAVTKTADDAQQPQAATADTQSTDSNVGNSTDSSTGSDATIAGQTKDNT